MNWNMALAGLCGAFVVAAWGMLTSETNSEQWDRVWGEILRG